METLILWRKVVQSFHLFLHFFCRKSSWTSSRKSFITRDWLIVKNCLLPWYPFNCMTWFWPRVSNSRSYNQNPYSVLTNISVISVFWKNGFGIKERICVLDVRSFRVFQRKFCGLLRITFAVKMQESKNYCNNNWNELSSEKDSKSPCLRKLKLFLLKSFYVNACNMKRFVYFTNSKSTVAFYGENPVIQKTSAWKTWCWVSSQSKKRSLN